VLGAEFPGPVERRAGHVDRDHPGAEGRADVHGRQPDPATAVHREPLPLAQPGVAGERPVGGGEPAAQAGRGDKVHGVRQRHQVRVRGMDGHLLGERPGAGEPGLGLIRADLGVARLAVLTPAATADERHRDPVARPPPGHRRPGPGDGPGQFVPGDVRQRDGVVPLPGVPIRPAHPRRADANDHAVVWAGRLGHVGHLRHDPVAGIYNCAQDCLPVARHHR
jgi:hypothetical protein